MNIWKKILGISLAVSLSVGMMLGSKEFVKTI